MDRVTEVLPIPSWNNYSLFNETRNSRRRSEQSELELARLRWANQPINRSSVIESGRGWTSWGNHSKQYQSYELEKKLNLCESSFSSDNLHLIELVALVGNQPSTTGYWMKDVTAQLRWSDGSCRERTGLLTLRSHIGVLLSFSGYLCFIWYRRWDGRGLLNKYWFR